MQMTLYFPETETGRSAHHHHRTGCQDKLIALADLVTEMKEIKHPYQKGIKAMNGIE